MPTRRTPVAHRFLVLCLLSIAAPPLLTPVALAQQPQQASAPSRDLAGIAHLAIRVSDLDASVAFYQKLGFVRAFALSRNGKVYEAFIKIDDRQFIELYPVDAKNAQPEFLHVCFEGANLQSVHDFYVAQGLAPTAVRTAGAGNLLFTMPGPLTPTGPQNMEYTEYMPGSLHSKDFGQHVGPDRIATKLVSVTIAAEDPTAAAAFYAGKAGFPPAGSQSASGKGFAIPGAPGEAIEIVPAASLGLRARFSLQLAPGMGAAALGARGIAFSKAGAEFAIRDPDGNEILLTSR